MNFFELDLYERKHFNSGDFEYSVKDDKNKKLKVKIDKFIGRYEVLNNDSVIAKVISGHSLKYKNYNLVRKNGFTRVINGHPDGELDIFWHDVNEFWQITLNGIAVANITTNPSFFSWLSTVVFTFKYSPFESWERIEFDSKKIDDELAISLLIYHSCPTE